MVMDSGSVVPLRTWLDEEEAVEFETPLDQLPLDSVGPKAS